MTLSKARIGQRGVVSEITGTEKIRRFLLTLGCSEGEEITLVSKISDNYVINVKDSRYAIDGQMARMIVLTEN